MKADLCTFAKAMANGYPISVLAGREDIMRRLGKGVVHGGTFTAHSIALAAAEKTPGDPRGNAGAADDRGVRHEAARGRQPDSCTARHPPFLQRPSLDERPLLQRAAAEGLSRLGEQRLHLLRSAGTRAARARRSLRAGLARAVVHLRGARCTLPCRNAEEFRDRRWIASSNQARSPEPAHRAG